MNTGPRTVLVVDLDGTLTKTDTLLEMVIGLFKRSPAELLRSILLLRKGKARFKEYVAQRSSLAVHLLPFRAPLIDYLREERASGRRIVLATASHRSVADKVSSHLSLFDEVLATQESRNLRGMEKLQAIRQSVGDEFAYAGNDHTDIPIWKAARAAVLVSVPVRTAAQVRRHVPIEREFPGDAMEPILWLRALRLHQWVKNLLLFVPLLTAFSLLDLEKLAATTVGFLAFSLVASATYIFNDLWDLENDREHPRKRIRPFASGGLQVLHGLAGAATLLLIGLVLAWAVSPYFVLIVLIYLMLTSMYSWIFKSYLLLDVILLAILYTLRILAGSIAAGVATSSWLLAFSVFIFFSLALVKRCAELVLLRESGAAATHGRDYRVSDLTVLWPMGVGAAVSAVVVFGLYISAPETQARYSSPHLLWLAAVALLYWLSRIWMKTSRGEMNDDPVIFAIRDRGSRLVALYIVAVVLVAQFVSFASTR